VSEQRTRAAAFELHVALLAARAAALPSERARLAAESFEVAQLARATDTADQLAKMAARLAAGTQGPAQLARARQDAVARLERLGGDLVSATTRPPAERDRAQETQLREQEDAARREVAALDARIEREFPRYRELTSPRPLTVAVAQSLLSDGEALLGFLVTGAESYGWAIRRNGVAFERLTITRAGLDDAVKRLRAGLDIGAGDPAAIVSTPFDVAAAHALYRTLLAPFEAMLAGVHDLLVVPDGALQSLPLAVLVTEPPARPPASVADQAAVPWLIKRYAVTVLPSASALQALRAFAIAAPGAEPFSGFGDPVLDGSPGAARGAVLASLLSRGAVADVGEVRKLPPLPETADELKAIAATLGASSDAVHLGPQATESAVKRLDLARYRTLAFATHGLMAGDFTGLAEPALVLTPPAQGSALDDGLLTASEIAQLQLNADWVVLSACNTASADGSPGAEGLSGLAKAFFYAGARALLVSHWSVGSTAAEHLTTRMFEEAARGAGKSEALRRAMVALMQRTDSPYFAHPALWAPFVVVGEGGAGR
jgi:CHAT domain-containing protein